MSTKAAPASSRQLPPHLSALVAQVLADNPVHRNFMNSALGYITEDEISHLEQYLEFCIQKGIGIPYLAECYLTIVSDTLREQIYFQKHKKYRYSTFAEVGDKVYFNEEYMSFYMYGLALTAFLWPNHIDIFRFFRETMPLKKTGSYLEIGPGHGYFLMTAMERSRFDSYTGVDISQTSINQTSALIEHFSNGRHKSFELKCMDFLQCDLPENAFDAVVMGEVLEHVEKPDLFLKQIARIAKKDAYIFVTTCINAPAVDHIFLFRTPEELVKLFDDCGLRIKKALIRPYEGKTEAESLAQQLPINVAYSLEKK